MPKNLKEFLFKYILSPFLAVMITLVSTGALSQNKKISNAASKDDVATVKYEMIDYTDKSIMECKVETEKMIESIDDVHKAMVDGIKSDMQDLKDGQATILQYILDQKSRE